MTSLLRPPLGRALLAAALLTSLGALSPAHADPTPSPTDLSSDRQRVATDDPLAAARLYLGARQVPTGSLRALPSTQVDGITVQRFHQTYDGYPVFGSQYAVRVRTAGAGSTVLGSTGSYVAGLRPDTTELIPADTAELVARLRLGRDWAPGARIEDGGGVILPVHGGVLTRELTVLGAHADGRPMRQRVLVRSSPPGVALAYDELDAFDATPVETTGPGLLGQTLPLHVTQTGPSKFTLLDQSRAAAGGSTIETFDADGRDQMSFFFGWDKSVKPFTSPAVPLTAAQNKSGALDAHWAAGEVVDFYAGLGRNGLDGAGGKVRQVVGVSDHGGPLANALWQGQFMVYGNGGQGYRPFSASLDVVAHEFTHGVTDHAADLVYLGQSGAMNEAFSDYFGNAIQNKVENIPTSSPDSGLLGEQLCRYKAPRACAIRDLNRLETTATFRGTTQDNGGVHMNSGIVGGTLWQIRRDLGDDLSDRLMLRVLTGYLVPLSQFTDLRYATLAAARDMGLDGVQQGAITKAFDDHGIRPGWLRSEQGWDARVRVLEVEYPFSSLAADGGHFAYADYTGSKKTDTVGVYLAKPSKGRPRVVTPRGKAGYDSPALGGGRLLWVRTSKHNHSRVQVKDLKTGKVADLGTLGGTLGTAVGVSRTTAAWLVADAMDDVKLYVVRGDRRVLVPRTKGYSFVRLAVRGDQVVAALVPNSNKGAVLIKSYDSRTRRLSTLARIQPRPDGSSPFVDDIALNGRSVFYSVDQLAKGKGSAGSAILQVGRRGGRVTTFVAEGSRRAMTAPVLAATNRGVAWAASPLFDPMSNADEPKIWWRPAAGGPIVRYSCGAGQQGSPTAVRGRRLVFWDYTTGMPTVSTRGKPAGTCR